MAVKASASIQLVRVNDGQAGSGVSNTSYEYYLSTSKTQMIGGSWTTTPPSWIKGKYLWIRVKTTYKNPPKTEYTTPIVDSSWESANNVENKLEQNYYDRTEIDVEFKKHSQGLESTVKEIGIIKKNIDELEVGGRNLIVQKNVILGRVNGSGVIDPSGPYKASDFIPVKPGETYILQVWPTSLTSIWVDDTYFKADKTYLTGYNGEYISSDHVVKKYTVPTGASFMRVSYTFAEGYRVKLELGNKPTDWTPAPEDVEAGIEAAHSAADKAQADNDALTERVVLAETAIKQTDEKISHMVMGVDENGKQVSLMEQTKNGWQFNMTSIQNTLKNASNKVGELDGTVAGLDETTKRLDSLLNDVANKTAYINMSTDDNGKPCIELGKLGDPFKVRITNTSVDFMEGSTKVAYISNNALYIEKSIIKNELQIGEGIGFVWKKRSNGNMGLRRVQQTTQKGV